MNSIKLPDGYNGDFVECEIDPIEKDGDNYKLRVKGSSYLIKWCSRQQWENAMWEVISSPLRERGGRNQGWRGVLVHLRHLRQR